MSFNFAEEILIIKGVHQNGFYIYFGEFKCLVYYNLIVCCSLDPVLVIWYVIFLEIQCYLSKLKSIFGMLNFGQVFLEKQLFQSF